METNEADNLLGLGFARRYHHSHGDIIEARSYFFSTNFYLFPSLGISLNFVISNR
jgi:hypothetical protein